MQIYTCPVYHHTCTQSGELISLAQSQIFSQQLQLMPHSVHLHLIQTSLNKHEYCIPFMTDHLTLLQTNLSILKLFVCVGKLVTTVIIFITVIWGDFISSIINFCDIKLNHHCIPLDTDIF